VLIPGTSSAGLVAVQIYGSMTGTVNFEGTVDGSHFVSVLGLPSSGGAMTGSATAAGVWLIPTAGYQQIRARVSALTGGTPAITLVRTQAGGPWFSYLSLPTALSVSSLTSAGAVSGTTGTFTGATTFPPTAGTTPSMGIWAAGFVPSTLTTGTDTTGIANQQWIAPVWVPCNTTLNGVSYLIGTVGGTDRAIAALYNAAGTTLLANSTTASGGTVVGTLATMQALNFTTPYAAVGPGLYWITIQTNNTNAHIRTVPLGTAFTGVQAAGGATPAATIASVPSSFTAAYAPIAELY
jgi:hypothetical protein